MPSGREPTAPSGRELYDLAADPGETHDLADESPEKRSELLGKLEAWRTAVGAEMPAPNPGW